MSNPIRKPTAGDLVGLLSLTLIWTTAFLAIKVAVPQTGPMWLAAIRVCIAFLVLLPWTLYRGIQLPSSAKQWLFIFGVSILNVSLPFYLISWAELEISAGMTSLLLGIGPLLALILSHFTTNDDRITPQKLIGISFGFTAIVLVVGREALSGLAGPTVLAQLAVLGASMCYAVSGAMIRKITDFPPTRLATLILGMCSIQLLILGIWSGMPDWQQINQTAWLNLIYLGLLPTGLATILRYRLIRTVGASFFALGMNLIPVFGLILGALILQEEVTAIAWTALALILTGLFIARLSKPPEDNKKAPSPSS